MIAAATTIEAGPEIDSVGFGGLPDRDGQVTLDACVAKSPASCGSVCGLRRHLHAARIARRIMEDTEHVMLAGEAADAFADSVGEPEADLLAPEARRPGTAGGRRIDVDLIRDAGRPIDRDGGRLFGGDDEQRWAGPTRSARGPGRSGRARGSLFHQRLAVEGAGRVGDSPIVGHGLYVDPGVAAVSATGSGELVAGVCGAMLAVECIRRGDEPLDALLTVLRRIDAAYEMLPTHQIGLVALQPTAPWPRCASGFKVACTMAGRDEAVPPDVVLHRDLTWNESRSSMSVRTRSGSLRPRARMRRVSKCRNGIPRAATRS